MDFSAKSDFQTYYPREIAHETSQPAGRRGIASSALLAVSRAYAAWPERPISLIVPYPVGGGTDIVARTLAPLLEREIGGTINVLNRPGGGGITGHEAVVRSTTNGYCNLSVTSSTPSCIPGILAHGFHRPPSRSRGLQGPKARRRCTRNAHHAFLIGCFTVDRKNLR